MLNISFICLSNIANLKHSNSMKLPKKNQTKIQRRYRETRQVQQWQLFSAFAGINCFYIKLLYDTITNYYLLYFIFKYSKNKQVISSYISGFEPLNNISKLYS